MATSNHIRYTGKPTTRYSYNYFDVVCPKCHEQATVSGKWENTNLLCPHCNFSEKLSERTRYNLHVKRWCDECGKRIEVCIPGKKEKTTSIAIPCPHCGTERSYRPRNEAYSLTYKNKSVGDPYFNLPLWYQSNVKGNLFWAWNRKHLVDIRQYVVSTLRERRTTYYTTMVEKLPSFIKRAGNREILLKNIDRILKK